MSLAEATPAPAPAPTTQTLAILMAAVDMPSFDVRRLRRLADVARAIERSGSDMTITELARELGTKNPNISNFVKEVAPLGLLKTVRKRGCVLVSLPDLRQGGAP